MECGSRPSTVRQAATMACPITWPPNTRCQLVFGLLPRNKFTSSGSRSRMASRSIRLLDIVFSLSSFRGASVASEPGIHTHDGGYGFRAWPFGPSRNDDLHVGAILFSHPLSPSYSVGASV